MKQQRHKNFEKNLKLFQLKNPRAAFLFVMEHGQKEAALPLATFEEQEGASPLMVVYGDPSIYAAYKKWLQKDPTHTLIILDDDLMRIQNFLETELAHDLLSDPQAHFYFYEGAGTAGKDANGNDIVHGKETLQEIAWGTFPETFSLVMAPGSSEEKFDALKKALFFETDDIHATLDEYVQWGAAYAKNFWPNLRFLPESTRGNKLFRQFKGVPAIIAAAGPSLTKQLDTLKGLEDKALIFAGGSAMNACLHGGVQPHFGGIIDPNPTQLKRLQESKNRDAPYFYRGRACHEALATVQGPKVYLTGGDGYFISEWFEKKLKIAGKILGGGHNISNFMIEIAAALGCSPIILVGFDLSYTDGAAYATGVTSEKQASIESPVDWIDVTGKPTKTHWKWLHEALWITDFQETHKRLPIINCTEGGIALKDIRHMPLQKALTRFSEQSNMRARVTEALQKAGLLKCTPQAIEKLKTVMKKSLEAVSEKLIRLIELLQKGKSQETSTDVVLLLQEIQQEAAYGYVLEVFERMRIKLEYYKRRFSLHPTMTAKKIRTFDQALLILRYNFLLQVVHVNLKLMDREVTTPTA